MCGPWFSCLSHTHMFLGLSFMSDLRMFREAYHKLVGVLQPLY